VVGVPGIGPVTCVALYGLLEELSDASVHRSLSDISPIFTDPDYKELVLVGGDLNTSAAWKKPVHRVRDQGVLERFEAYGLVDCLKRVRGSERLKKCYSTRTRTGPGDRSVVATRPRPWCPTSART
jgi:hypothetical protein